MLCCFCNETVWSQGSKNVARVKVNNTASYSETLDPDLVSTSLNFGINYI